MRFDVSSLQLGIEVERDVSVWVPGVSAKVKMFCPFCGQLTLFEARQVNLTPPGGGSIKPSMNRLDDLHRLVTVRLTSQKPVMCQACGLLSGVIDGEAKVLAPLVAQMITLEWLSNGLDRVVDCPSKPVPPGVMEASRRLVEHFRQTSNAN